MTFIMNHARGAGSITQPVDQYPSTLPLPWMPPEYETKSGSTYNEANPYSRGDPGPEQNLMFTRSFPFPVGWSATFKLVQDEGISQIRHPQEQGNQPHQDDRSTQVPEGLVWELSWIERNNGISGYDSVFRLYWVRENMG